MNRHLPIPDDLRHLIEKRDRETDRRDEERDRRQLDLGPLGPIESADALEDAPTEDRREEASRRTMRRRMEDGKRS